MDYWRLIDEGRQLMATTEAFGQRQMLGRAIAESDGSTYVRGSDKGTDYWRERTHGGLRLLAAILHPDTLKQVLLPGEAIPVNQDPEWVAWIRKSWESEAT